MFKIVTFNIWGTFGPTPEERWAYASECLAKLEADIICLQEATDIKLLERLAGITQKKLIHSDCDQTGLAVLSNLPFLDFGLIPYDTKSPIEDYIRKFIWVQLKHQDKEFLLTNTHLSWKANDDESRTLQAAELARFVSQRKMDAFLCGDFNCDYSRMRLEAFQQAGFEDMMKNIGREHEFTWDNRNPLVQGHVSVFPDRRLDLILGGPASPAFKKDFPLLDCGLTLNQPNPTGLFPSDHYGVMASFDR